MDVIKIKAIALGSIILTSDKQLLATGASEQFTSPSKEFYQFTTIASGVTDFDASDQHMLYLEDLEDKQQLYAMGNNAYGQLWLPQPESVKVQNSAEDTGELIPLIIHSKQIPTKPSFLELLKSNLTLFSHSTRLQLNHVDGNYKFEDCESKIPVQQNNEEENWDITSSDDMNPEW